ncbi:MAG: hypothetical protein WBF55_10615 [Syntrophobacteria bacterium]
MSNGRKHRQDIWLARLILVPRRLHSLTRQLLASVKQEAEARYQAQKVS